MKKSFLKDLSLANGAGDGSFNFFISSEHHATQVRVVQPRFTRPQEESEDDSLNEARIRLLRTKLKNISEQCNALNSSDVHICYKELIQKIQGYLLEEEKLGMREKKPSLFYQASLNKALINDSIKKNQAFTELSKTKLELMVIMMSGRLRQYEMLSCTSALT